MLQLLQDSLLELDVATQGVSRLLPKARREVLLKQYEQQEEQDQFLLTNAGIHASLLGRYGDKMAHLMTPLLKRPANCLFSDDLNAVESWGAAVDRRMLRSNRRLQEEKIQNSDELAPVVFESAPSERTGTPVQDVNKPGFVTVDEGADQIAAVNSSLPDLSTSVVTASVPDQIETSAEPKEENVVNETDFMQNTTDASVISASVAVSDGVKIALIDASSITDGGAKDTPQTADESDPLGSPPRSDVRVPSESIDAVHVNDSETKVGTDVILAAEPLTVAQGAETMASELIEVIPPTESIETIPVGGIEAQIVGEIAATTVQIVVGETVENVGSKEVVAASVPSAQNSSANKDGSTAKEVSGIIVDSEPNVANDDGSKGELIQIEEQAAPLEPPSDEATTTNQVFQATVDAVVVDNVADSDNATTSISDIAQVDDSKPVLTEDGLCEKVSFYQKDMLAKVVDGESFVVEISTGRDGGAYLMACFRSCTSGNCIKAMEGLDSVKVSVGNVEIEVDGVPVMATHEIDSCHLLEGKSNGLSWKTRRDAYRIRFRVTEEGGAILLYSVIAL